MGNLIRQHFFSEVLIDYDRHFGASLSYVNSSGTGGSDAPQVLDNVMIPSLNEVGIFVNTPCTNGDCGYIRPGSVGYREYLWQIVGFLLLIMFRWLRRR